MYVRMYLYTYTHTRARAHTHIHTHSHIHLPSRMLKRSAKVAGGFSSRFAFALCATGGRAGGGTYILVAYNSI